MSKTKNRSSGKARGFAEPKPKVDEMTVAWPGGGAPPLKTARELLLDYLTGRMAKVIRPQIVAIPRLCYPKMWAYLDGDALVPEGMRFVCRIDQLNAWMLSRIGAWETPSLSKVLALAEELHRFLDSCFLTRERLSQAPEEQTDVDYILGELCYAPYEEAISPDLSLTITLEEPGGERPAKSQPRPKTNGNGHG